jgi:DNA polymerase III delta subunit
LIILKNIERLNQKEKDNLIEHLRKKNKFSIWILTLGETKSNKSAFVSDIAKIASVKICQAPYKDGEIKAYIRREFQNRNISIQHEAVELMFEHSSKDLTILTERIETLRTFAGLKKEITVDDVVSLYGKPISQNIFLLYEALQNRDFDFAYRMVKQLMNEGKSPHEILQALIWQYDRNMKIKNLLAAGVSGRDIADKMKINGYFLNKTLNQARKLSQTQAEGELRTLVEYDVSIKRGHLRPDLAIERCLLDLLALQTS